MSFSKSSAAAPRKEVERKKKSAAPSYNSQIDSCFSADYDDECESLNSLSVKCEDLSSQSFQGFSYQAPPPAPSSGPSSFLSSVSNFFSGPPPPPPASSGPPPPFASSAPAPPPPAGPGSSSGGVFGQDALIALLLCQSFEGSFTENAANLLTGLTAAKIKGAVPAGVDVSLWITLVVLAFLEIKVSSFQEQWEMNQRKAQKWAKSKTSDFVSLQQQAKTFVSSN